MASILGQRGRAMALRIALGAAACGALLAGLTGCAAPSRPTAAQLEDLWDDAHFGSPALPAAEPLFALSPAMRGFLATEMRAAARQHGALNGLFRALQQDGRLRLEYDASLTRTASEAFEARAGNCLSLVLMTAALAREMGLSVQYQLVEVPDIWSRSDQFLLLNLHVNLSLGSGPLALGSTRSWDAGRTLIDFQPFEDPRLARVRPLGEPTLVAMYFNNRAVERMEQGDPAGAYAALRAALRADPAHLNALNTLAVLYRRAGLPARAEAALRLALALEAHNRHAAANLALLLRASGRAAEAERLEANLPAPPFADFDRGLQLAGQAQWEPALRAFERQLRRSPDFHGLHFQLARVHFELGHLEQARRHLEEAAEQASTLGLRSRYETKLKALRRLARSG